MKRPQGYTHPHPPGTVYREPADDEEAHFDSHEQAQLIETIERTRRALESCEAMVRCNDPKKAGEWLELATMNLRTFQHQAARVTPVKE